MWECRWDQLTSTVLPFILRGINLLGIDSVNVPINKRGDIWDKIANKWNISQTTLISEISLEELPQKIESIKMASIWGEQLLNIKKHLTLIHKANFIILFVLLARGSEYVKSMGTQLGIRRLYRIIKA